MPENIERCQQENDAYDEIIHNLVFIIRMKVSFFQWVTGNWTSATDNRYYFISTALIQITASLEHFFPLYL
jgi:hypothetical protein